MHALEAVLTDLAEATSWLLHDVSQLPVPEWTHASLLPGWTCAHVVTHLAQNADAGVRLLTWARTGVPSFEYASVAERAVAINRGFRRPAEVQVQHLQASHWRFHAHPRP
jgi:maleylpyruvate isomerase